MRTLKRIVSMNYPASRLPERWRGDADSSARVMIVVEEKGPEGSSFETTVQDFADLPHGPIEK